VLLFVSLEGETACSGLIEVGAALALGKQVWVLSPYWWSFSNHPHARTFTTLEAAVAAIVARTAGERARMDRDRDFTTSGIGS
jgi:hypothetical protein